MKPASTNCVTVFIFDDDMDALVIQSVPLDLRRNILFINKNSISYRPNRVPVA